MAKDLEVRVEKLEMNFEAYMSIFYKWLDEQRTEMKEFRKWSARAHGEHEDRMQKIEDQTARLIETQGVLVQILRSMDDKLDNHDNRLSAAGI